MNRLSLRTIFANILLLAVPLNCGRTALTPSSAPTPICMGAVQTAYPWRSLLDGGTPADGGAAVDGDAAGGATSEVNLPASICRSACGVQSCTGSVDSQGVDTVTCPPGCHEIYPVGCGRRPEGLAALDGGSDDPLARYFEEAAHLEAASVHAFLRLAAELRLHAAPQPLVQAAERAAGDEIRHTRAMSRLARRYGGAFRSPPRGPQHLRPLVEIAVENAVEGCVRETYGALVAWVQAESAHDPRVRRTMRVIAADETEHAALAWEVAQWMAGKLSAEDRQQVYTQARLAAAQLSLDAAVEPALALQQQAGVPAAAVAAQLVAHAQKALWSHLGRGTVVAA